MGGTTGPATAAGTLVVQHAEVLAALVLGQAAAEGSPFIYGGLSAMSSMRTGAVHFGAPEFALLADATARLSHHAGLPVRAGAAATDAHVPDAQAALESAVGLSAGVSAGADFMVQAAGILSSFNAISLEKFVMDDEMISVLRALQAPTPADTDALAVDVIDAVGPAGDYLREPHTRRHVRDLDRQTFLVREACERWRSRGEADVRDAAAREVECLLEAHEPPDDLDGLVRRQIDEYCLG
jgi:trimethylamine--corrinoid protein Co-methyltransferase